MVRKTQKKDEIDHSGTNKEIKIKQKKQNDLQ